MLVRCVAKMCIYCSIFGEKQQLFVVLWAHQTTFNCKESERCQMHLDCQSLFVLQACQSAFGPLVCQSAFIPLICQSAFGLLICQSTFSPLTCLGLYTKQIIKLVPLLIKSNIFGQDLHIKFLILSPPTCCCSKQLLGRLLEVDAWTDVPTDRSYY